MTRPLPHYFPRQTMIRIVISANTRLFLMLLRDVLKKNFQIVGASTDKGEIIRLTSQEMPDVVLLDLAIPEAMFITESLKQNSRILVIGNEETLSRDVLLGAMREGVFGFLVKNCNIEDIIQAIVFISQGHRYVYPTVVNYLFDIPGENSKENGLTSPTPRELQTIRYIAQGYTNRQTAKNLGVSTRTIESHRSSLTDKVAALIGKRDRASVLAFAKKKGWLD